MSNPKRGDLIYYLWANSEAERLGIVVEVKKRKDWPNAMFFVVLNSFGELSDLFAYEVSIA
jgi:hypothetical protein